MILSNQQLAAAYRIRITAEALEAAYAKGYRTMDSVGQDFGVSRERIRQLTLRYGINTHYVRVPRRVCDECGKPISRRNVSGLCRKHKPPAETVTRSCGWCNAPITRSAATQKTLDKNNVHGEMFCSREHRVWWQGKNGYHRPRKVML